MTAAAGATTAAALAASGVAGVRWLRVAQREHYLPGSVTRFALRWWKARPASVGLGAAGLTGAVASFEAAAAGLISVAAVATGPLGLGLRGRTSKLAWTRRLRTLAAVWGGFQVVAVVAGWLAGMAAPVSALGALAVPFLVDLALVVTRPVEAMLARRYVDAARQKLDRVAPTVVAITGSYGKTSTKAYVAHLLAGTYSVVASPASFNNRAGLARTVTENLTSGTQVLVAEMGTYGKGEIAEMCSWMVPEVAVITAIGPVHLERFGSEGAIVEAKAEITERAKTAVLNVDSPPLAGLAAKLADEGKAVLRCSATDRSADVCVVSESGSLGVYRNGKRLVPPEAAGEMRNHAASNVACAVAVALALGVPAEQVEDRISTLPSVPNRLSVHRSEGGFTILDDTYNSNPAGARAALAALSRHARENCRRVVVTPGMVELGPRQREENAAFASDAAAVATDVVVVGRTNRRALLEGSTCGSDRNVITVGTREQAVAWARSQLGDGDVVLYENDLPDHYP